ncbi:GAF domain-containing protein [Myxococcaceae bacterium JPH2]|nr:GAF domain-containing protein [Myxococcaceae bacterium JPH2]
MSSVAAQHRPSADPLSDGAEDLLRGELLHLLVEESSEGVVLVQVSGRVLAFNTVASRHFGIPPPASLERGQLPGCEWVRADGGPLAEEASPLARALRGERVSEGRWELRRPDGRRVVLRGSALPVMGERGRTAAVLLRTHEESPLPLETSRLLAEAGALLGATLETDERLEPLLRLLVPALAEAAVLCLGLPGETARVAAAVHVDPTKQVLLTEMLRRYPPEPASSGRGLPGALMAIATERTVLASDEALTLGARDAEHARMLSALRPHCFLAVPLVARGRVIGVLALLRSDVARAFSAEEEQLTEELADRTALCVDNARLLRESREAVRLRDEFLGIASHELKTPLTPLSLKVQMLQKQLEVLTTQGKTLPVERVAETLEVVQRQVRRLTSLVDNLLDVSRITAGRLRLELEEMDLASVAAEILYRFAPSAAQHETTLELHAPVPVVGRWDRLRLEQVVTNLLSNALKYGAGNPISLSVESDGRLARLTVRDGGIGISREDLARIFERFERAVSDRHYGGLGLGLYITRQIVEAFGGNVRATSVLGEGSTFILELPRGEDIPDEWLTAHAAPGPTQGE